MRSARELSTRLAAFDALSMPQSLRSRAREVQLSMAAGGDHDRDYERIAAVTTQEQAWFVPEDALA